MGVVVSLRTKLVEALVDGLLHRAADPDFVVELNRVLNERGWFFGRYYAPGEYTPVTPGEYIEPVP